MTKALAVVVATIGFLAIDLPAFSADAPKAPAGYKRTFLMLDKTNVTALLRLPEKATEMQPFGKKPLKYRVSNAGDLPGDGDWSLQLYDTAADKTLRIAKTPKERYEQAKDETK